MWRGNGWPCLRCRERRTRCKVSPLNAVKSRLMGLFRRPCMFTRNTTPFPPCLRSRIVTTVWGTQKAQQKKFQKKLKKLLKKC